MFLQSRDTMERYIKSSLFKILYFIYNSHTFLLIASSPKEIKINFINIVFCTYYYLLIESILTFKVKNYDNYDYRTKFEVYDLKGRY